MTQGLLCILATLRETLVLSSLVVVAVTSTTAAREVSVGTVSGDLNRPSAIAVRPGSTAVRFELFVAESGAGRIVRWLNRSPSEVEPAVTGFSTATAETLFEQTGPRALWFIDPVRLVVAASSADDSCSIYVFDLPDDSSLLTVEDAIDRPRVLASATAAGPAACCSLTRSRANEFVPDMLVASIRDADGRAALYKMRVQAGEVGSMMPFADDALANGAAERMAVATSNSGRVVVAQSPAADNPSSGRLTFLNPIDGSVDLEMPLDLEQVVDLAYSPSTGLLYAADFAGGIHRIDDASEPGRPACRIVQVADIRHPTALVFAPDGSLYVTTFGSADVPGTLQVLTGDL